MVKMLKITILLKLLDKKSQPSCNTLECPLSLQSSNSKLQITLLLQCTRFKGTATLGSRGDYRYPDELARWTKSFRESASESQVSLLRLLGWHKIPPHFTLCKNNDKCPVEMRREDGS
ncbi:hypothetical protein POPTR_018G088050v4 [Populus trichocarpa]|uniref:Uncharacterized protein n=1 Tax=Populus trichocarpa TaxID=3694 RepID=A0A3N7GAM4_POPTR|nr:hypothetical protein BDE02_18G070400 [Populus trichocarpa]RQP02901.1 hypothetical protein POPTR_018G088050v4 [Populus trichocarpa]